MRVEFDWGTDIYLARQIVSEKLASVGEQMPAGVSAPVLGPQSSILGEVFIVSLTSDHTSQQDLRTYADWVIRPRLLSTGGVAQVSVHGGDIKEYQILISPGRMKKFKKKSLTGKMLRLLTTKALTLRLFVLVIQCGTLPLLKVTRLKPKCTLAGLYGSY